MIFAATQSLESDRVKPAEESWPDFSCPPQNVHSMVYSDEDYLTLDPELKAIFDTRKGPKPQIVTHKTLGIARSAFDAAAERYNTSHFARSILGQAFDTPTWAEQDVHIRVRDGSTIKIRVYSPKRNPQGASPVIVQCHGGGFFMGNLDTDALICRIFCSQLWLTVVNVDYRLHPEVGFGVPLLDFYDAVKWTSKNTGLYGGDVKQGFILSGNSGGGTYAAIAAHLARDDNLDPGITGCFLTCPILSDQYFDEHGRKATIYDHNTEYRSWWQNGDAPLMNNKMRLSAANFADWDLSSKLFSPFHFPSHSRVPPTYIVACGLDMYRDGCFLYQKELENDNVATKVDVYPGLPHCWWTSYPEIAASQRWYQNSIAGMKWLLMKTENRRMISKL